MAWKVAPSYTGWRIDNIYEEDKKADISTPCWKCGGSGKYLHFGECYACNGAGRKFKTVKIYTEDEFDKYVANQERVRARKEAARIAKQEELENKSEENKAEWLEKNGFDPKDPAIYAVVGNTYEIKEVLKERGGRYTPAFNWYFTKETEVPEGYYLAKIPFDTVYTWYPQTKYASIKEEISEIVKRAKEAVLPESNSQYLGEIKERLRDMKVTLTGCRGITTNFGESILFTFDFNGNTLVWFTTSVPDEEKTIVGNTYTLTGTVKKHEVYNGVKTTYLNRCVIKTI